MNSFVLTLPPSYPRTVAKDAENESLSYRRNVILYVSYQNFAFAVLEGGLFLFAGVLLLQVRLHLS